MSAFRRTRTIWSGYSSFRFGVAACPYEPGDVDVLLAGWRPSRRWLACPQPAPQNIAATRLQNHSVVSGFSRTAGFRTAGLNPAVVARSIGGAMIAVGLRPIDRHPTPVCAACTRRAVVQRPEENSPEPCQRCVSRAGKEVVARF